jgi:membrane fusion protein, multidrug efflux system
MKTKSIVVLMFMLGLLAACEPHDPVEAKKKKLNKMKTEAQELRNKIESLESEIAAADPQFARANRKAALITTLPVKQEDFQHFVEVSGQVESKRNVVLSAENMGAVLSIPATEGKEVGAGQLLLSLDTELYQRNLDQLNTQYELAHTVYERQANLWKRNIGTEVQYLEAKNRKETLERQIDNIKTQISKSQIKAPFPGTIDQVLVKVGEMAQPGMPLIRIVNHRDMYVKADLSEAYIGRFKQNDPVEVFFPSLNQSLTTTISAIGQVIDEQNRTFLVEAKLPAIDFTVKPNLTAILRLKDFHMSNARVVPTNLIQKDNRGEFVYIVKDSSDTQLAWKVHIERGITYRNETVVMAGLEGDEQLIRDGYREVTHGNRVRIVENVL